MYIWIFALIAVFVIVIWNTKRSMKQRKKIGTSDFKKRMLERKKERDGNNSEL